MTRLKEAIAAIAEDGPFDANNVLALVIQAGITDNAGDVATALVIWQTSDTSTSLGATLPGGNGRGEVAEATDRPNRFRHGELLSGEGLPDEDALQARESRTQNRHANQDY